MVIGFSPTRSIQRIFNNPTFLTSYAFFGNHSNINPLKSYSIIRLFENRHFFVANATVGLSNILYKEVIDVVFANGCDAASKVFISHNKNRVDKKEEGKKKAQ